MAGLSRVMNGKGWQLARWAAAGIVAGGVLAALGPFGSYLNGGIGSRLFYWVAVTMLGLVLYGAAVVGAMRLAGWSGAARWSAVVVLALAVSLPEAVLSRALAFWMWPVLGRLQPTLMSWYGQTATMGVLSTLGGYLLLRRGAGARTAPEPAPPPEEKLKGDVLALQMEDHYVRIHRASGSELLLMPLGRAIAGVAGEGMRTHRSWWVARRAVAMADGTPRAMRLHLTNGVVAPVARSAVIHLREAGWIDDEGKFVERA